VAHTALITQHTDKANAVECTKLALKAPGARVLRLTRLRYDEPHRPIALEEVVLPLDRFPGLTADASDITELAQCYDLSLGRACEHVSIVAATKDVAAHLGIAVGANVMKLDRIVETADGKPIEWRVTFRKID
jgi:DNA-binding GntR family transcriptional regulator